jgi:hypothetical protein
VTADILLEHTPDHDPACDSTLDDVVASLPDDASRWRCGACGNLTRFDVTRTRRTTEFWHVDLAGEPRVEETTTESERVDAVTCRWCGRSDAVEVVARSTAEAPQSEQPTASDPSPPNPQPAACPASSGA